MRFNIVLDSESGAAVSAPQTVLADQDSNQPSEQERMGLPQTYQQEPIFTTEPPGAPSPRIVTSQGASSSRSTISQASSRSVTSVSEKKPSLFIAQHLSSLEANISLIA